MELKRLVSLMMAGAVMVVYLLSLSCMVREMDDLEQPPVYYAVEKYSMEYDIDPGLLFAVRHRESLDGQHLWSDSKKVLSRQEWVYNLPIKKLEAQYGKRIWWCVGDWQVSYLTAYDMGYRGSPISLGTNVMTNCKYASKILRHYLDKYPNYYRNAISAYNMGTPEIIKNEFVNSNYVNDVDRYYIQTQGYE